LRESILAHAGDPLPYNHLAWILVTAKDRRVRRPAEALELARKAVALDRQRSPAILDTLAEACYANRLFEEAVANERLAVSKGGPTYQASLDRFLQALEAEREGRAVTLTDSPLVDHGKFEVVMPAQPFDPETIPAPPRVPAGSYASRLQDALRRLRLADADTAMQALAGCWNECAPTAIDNPKADLQQIILCLLGLRWDAPRVLTRADLAFLQTLSAAFDETGEPLPEALPALAEDDRQHLPEAFARRVAFLLIRRCSRAQVGRILQSLAAGTLRVSELYLAGYYDGTYWRAPLPDVTVARAVWEKIAARFQAAADGQPLDALAARPRAPAPAPPPLGSGLAPPPEDKDELWDP